MKILIAIALIAFIGIGIVFAVNKQSLTISSQKNQPPTSLTSQGDDAPQIAVVSQNLDTPWAIAFLPHGEMLVTERPGKVRIVHTDGSVDPTPAATISVDIKSDGEGGLLGIALHPNFSENKYVYLYYTYLNTQTQTLNRVVRMKFENNKLSGEEIIIDKIPGAFFHNGGRIKFGPDNFLYVTTGDSQEPSFAQNKTSLAGKILRVTDTGSPAVGNAFNNRIYSYGHRNPQGIAWNASGNLWATEHGRSSPLSGLDELNLIENGKNYGWPIIEGDETRAGMLAPKKNSGATTTWAPAGAAFVNNSLFFAGLKGQTLYEAVILNNEVVEVKEHFSHQYGRLREVILGPDGMLYVTTSNRDGRGSPSSGDDKILRINPEKL